MNSRIAAVLALALTTSVFAADWPQFAGINRDAVSAETGLLKSWPAAGPKVLWTTKVGEGFAGSAIRDNQVYLLDRSGNDQTAKDILRCLDLATGEELWSYTYDAPGKSAGFNGSRAVPTVTDKLVFSVGPFGHLKCLDRATHKLVWETNIIEPGAKLPPWNIAQSPLLYKDTVIVGSQGKNGLTAYDQATGKQLWQASVPSAPYCSPKLLTLSGVEQVVLTHGSGVASVDPATGAPLWKFSGWRCNIPIPNVTAIGTDQLFISGGYKAGSVLIQIEGSQPKELWRTPKGSQVHQPIVLDGCIYFNGTTNDTPNEGLVCLEAATGKVLWQTGATTKLTHADLILADGLIYLMDSTGTLTLVQPNKEAFKAVSSTKLLAGKDIWAPMALSNGKLVLRDQSQMKCLELKGQ